MTGAISSGSISVVLSDGEVCTGRWAEVPRLQVPKGANTAIAPADNMSSVWDTVYGSGYYVSHVLGARSARGTISGNRGTVLNVELYATPEGEHTFVIKGVAKDNKDNIYKVVD